MPGHVWWEEANDVNGADEADSDGTGGGGGGGGGGPGPMHDNLDNAEAFLGGLQL
jgi:hypothetical protein